MSQHGCPERLSNRSKGFQEDGPSQPTMEVLVETLTGTAFEMTVSPSDTIFAIKSKIFRVEGIPVSQQHLLYNLKELDNASSLHEHAICDGARLRLVLGMCGGPITTRRLPPPPSAEPWRDIERLLDTNSREESEWGGNGCKVTVLVFREGERVNMLRVRENRDGTYSPLDHNKLSSADSSSLTHLLEQEPDDGLSGSLHENAVTMGKMLDLRRRMENLSVQRRRSDSRPDKPEIQKTRSEETLSVPSLLDEASDASAAGAYAYSDSMSFAPLYDGNYTRYEYDCSFGDRYSLLPGIGPRSDSAHSVQDAVHDSESGRLNALAGSILVGGRREDEAAMLEARLDASAERDSPPLHAANLAAVPAAEYGTRAAGSDRPLYARGSPALEPVLTRGVSAGGPADAAGGGGWRAARFGSLGSVGAPALARAPPPRPARAHAPLSSSTSDLEQLKRNRILPTLSRHRNSSHLHLSDSGLDVAPRPRNLEVGSERRARRIERIAEMTSREAAPPPERAASPPASSAPPAGAEPPGGASAEPEPSPEPAKERKVRLRCGLCSKRLSIATVHRCRCGAQFCAPHRYAEVHGCLYDYKAHAHHYLQRANPLVSAPKLPKI